jgi:hypothetical protein
MLNLFVVAPAHAVLMKLVFKGSIMSLSSDYAIPGINLGDEVAGELIFDPTTSDTQPITFIGLYSDAIKNLNFAIGNKNFSLLQPPPAPTTEIVVINDDLVSGKYYDSIFFRAAVIDQATQDIRFFQLTFSQSGVIQSMILTSDALAASIDLNAFEGQTGFLTYMPPGASQGNNINLTLLSLYPVSESSIIMGDVNGDLTVNLADAIIAMQVISNMIPSGTAYKSADVNGDGKIDMAEVIYILQKIAWTRQN